MVGDQIAFHGVKVRRRLPPTAGVLGAGVSMVAAVVLLTWTMASAAASVKVGPLTLTARLKASDNAGALGGAVLFSSPAASGGVIAGGAPWATIGSNERQGAVYVFAAPPAYSSPDTESAKLVESDGQAGDEFGGVAAMSGDVIVVGRHPQRGMALYVFTKPAAGWAGTLSENAQLMVSASGAGGLQTIAMSGDTIVVGTTGACGCSPAAYVFTKPVGAWSGAVHESATLTVPGGSYPCMVGQGSLAIDGTTIVASCAGHAFVFEEPAAGWTGDISPSATLLARGSTVESVAILGSNIAAGLSSGPNGCAIDPVVFAEPARGWSGMIRPAATLNVGRVCSDAVNDSVAVSQGEIAALLIPQNDGSCQIFYTCTATLDGFREPVGGWKGLIAGASTSVGIATPAGVSPPAVDGHTIVTAGQGELDLFTAQPGAPASETPTLTGAVAGRPRLGLTVLAGIGAPPIRSLALQLPPALRFATSTNSLTANLDTSVPRRSMHSIGRALTIDLRTSADHLAVSIRFPALIARPALIANLRSVSSYNRRHRTKRTVRLSIGCTITDTAGHTTVLTLKIRIP